MLVEPVGQNRVSKRAWESNVPVWTNFPPGHPKMFEKKHVRLGNFKHYQFISDFLLMLFPMKRLGK